MLRWDVSTHLVRLYGCVRAAGGLQQLAAAAQAGTVTTGFAAGHAAAAAGATPLSPPKAGPGAAGAAAAAAPAAPGKVGVSCVS